MKTLADTPVGVWLEVTNLLPGNNHYRQKLLSEGLVPGATFKVRWVAPLGDPIVVQLREQHTFSLRRPEAQILEVQSV